MVGGEGGGNQRYRAGGGGPPHLVQCCGRLVVGGGPSLVDLSNHLCGGTGGPPPLTIENGPDKSCVLF